MDLVDGITSEAEITSDIIRRALRKTKSNKVLGLGNMRMELLKYSSEKVVECMKRIFNKIICGETIYT